MSLSVSSGQAPSYKDEHIVIMVWDDRMVWRVAANDY
jgi:hypothetical protein